MRVLIHGVVAAEVSGGADGDALLVGDFFRVRSGAGRNKFALLQSRNQRMRKMIAESDARGGSFDLRFERSVVRWRELRGHDGCAALY